jgi:hypothetical protein
MKRIQAIFDSAVLAALTGVLLAMLPGCAGVSMSQLSHSFRLGMRQKPTELPADRPLIATPNESH